MIDIIAIQVQQLPVSEPALAVAAAAGCGLLVVGCGLRDSDIIICSRPPKAIGRESAAVFG